jgi:NAD-dependent histone deacetylase SIR2
MLATLAEEGRLMRLYTQNVDGIDTSLEPLATKVPLNAKGPWPKTIQLHGGLMKMVCQKCTHLSDFDGTLFEGPEAPTCKNCETTHEVRMAAGLRGHGIGRLRPRMVLYNEDNPDADAIGAVSHADIKNRPDAVIVVGTSLKIPGVRRLVKELCATTRDRRGGFTAWINTDPEPVGVDLKNCWDMVVRAESDDIARTVCLPMWDDKDCGDYRMIEGEEAKATKKSKSLVRVVLGSKPPDAIKTEGMLTPTDSPRQQSPQPLTKLKQLPLSFAAAKSAAGKDSKPKKKAGRKPLPSAKPKNKITNAFTSTKTSKPTAQKAISASSVDTLFPNMSKANEVWKPKPIKTPRTPPRVASPSALSSDSDLTPPPSSIPEVVIYSSYNRHETVSPPRIPSGMAHLID